MNRREIGTVSALILASLALSSVNFGSPFLHHNESCGTQVGKLARNFLKFGYGAAGFGVLDVSGPSLAAYDDYRRYHYTTHPPMTYWLASLTMRVVRGEGGVRLLPALFAPACVAALYFLVRRRDGPGTAAAAGMILAAMPMFAYNAIATVHLVIVLFFLLAALTAYLAWRETGRTGFFVALAALQIVACWTDWQGYYLAPLVAAHLWLTDRSRWRYAAALIALNLASFAAYAGFVYSLDPAGKSGLALLFGAGGERMSIRLKDLPRYVFGESREVLIYFTLPVVALAAWEAIRSRDRLLLCLLFLGLDEVLFIPYAMNHDYFTFCLCPFFAWAAARRIAALARPGGPSWFRPLAWVCALFFALQGGMILSNRWSRQGGYEFYYRMARAMDAATRPDEKLFLFADDIRFYTPYYADRYVLWYDRRSNQLAPENSGARRAAAPEDVRELLRQNRDGFAYAVTATPEGIRRNVAFLAGSSDEALRAFGVDEDYRGFLQSLCGTPTEKFGFLFWRLPRR